MGIPNVWKELEPLKRSVSLVELAVREGFLRNARKNRTLVVGIDASVWIVECQAVFYVRGLHTQAGENPELRTLFFRLAHLLHYPITPIFVFDGPERPNCKCGTTVKKKDHSVVKYLIKLIKDFRYKFHMAPGEAEAELAELERHGIIDFAITTDSDYFLFGGTRLIRNLHIKTPGDDDAEIYVTKDTAAMAADYDTVGLPGCGIVTAVTLSSTPLAADLLAAAEGSTEAELELYIPEWRSQLRKTLITNPNGDLPNHRTTLASKIPDDFPNPHVVYLYARPVTSWSKGGCGPQFDNLQPQFPDTEQLAFHCERLFGWGTTIVDKFQRYVWPGYCIRTFSQSLLTPSSIRHIYKQDNKFKSNSAFESYGIEMWLRPLPVVALSGARRALEDENAVVKGDATCTSLDVWVPGPILRNAAPAVVDTFLRNAPSRMKKATVATGVYVPLLPAIPNPTPTTTPGSIIFDQGTSMQSSSKLDNALSNEVIELSDTSSYHFYDKIQASACTPTSTLPNEFMK
ncbi:uncharacterized protein LACBIDRAFT_316211 [Laccaria bicolor S238N-H82]|uniref:Predicted protein n=1 Tax=Laccaria bicolor (strain S238N-H82 / ATCC MYA-4686) TaxID=486041 RepID=B0E0F8_LACBS|nr:uncharacterized protein LACBIDRAFT_316211 [Laccaria bicolor S238N-H82]EDQ99679.1 predicted protein [Laccaria bicolor S238N-H82]|eukprot:XP_001889656.1 predicted protein [Laccaria bicolor S238N-H82]